MDDIFKGKTLHSLTEIVSAQGKRGGCHEECHCHDDCDHDDCHCIQSVVERTATCFEELRGLAREVFRCLGCGHSEGRLLTIFTCLILEDINCVFKEVLEIKEHMCCKHHRTAGMRSLDEYISHNVTSGTVFVTNGQTDKVRVAVANNTSAPQTVRVRILNCCINPHTVINEMLLEVNSGCSGLIMQHLLGASSYEIQVFNLAPGMTVSSVEEAKSGSLIDGTKLTATAFIPHLGV